MIRFKQLFLVPFYFLIAMSASCSGQAGPEMKPKEFSEKCYAENTILLDVRTPEEYEQGHLKGATLIDYLEEKSFNEEIAKLDKNKTVYVYCRSGGRSGNAQEIMLKQGFKNVVNMDGGIDEWKKQGLPIEK